MFLLKNVRSYQLPSNNESEQLNETTSNSINFYFLVALKLTKNLAPQAHIVTCLPAIDINISFRGL